MSRGAAKRKVAVPLTESASSLASTSTSCGTFQSLGVNTVVTPTVPTRSLDAYRIDGTDGGEVS